MQISLALLGKRRFAPLFATQMLGAFNDNLFKIAMVLFVTYQIYNDEAMEAQFSAVSTGLFILPFFLFSALAGQLADSHDKAKIIRIVKTAEIFIIAVGVTGLLLGSIPLMLTALFALGLQSTFFGPIKYALLPQHLPRDEVLGGTGLIEAGTYVAILGGTIIGGIISVHWAAALAMGVAIAGWFSGRQVPPAPPATNCSPVDYNIIRSSIRLVSETMHIRRLFLAIVAISFFWTIGAVLIVEFPPLVKNVIHGDPSVASLFLAIFSIGVAAGSVIINRLLKGEVSAKFAPASVIGMGVFVLYLHFVARRWPEISGPFMDFTAFLAHPLAPQLLIALGGIAVLGGMFVVPLYAFLTTTVTPDRTARTVAANNIVNSGAMVLGAVLMMGIAALGVSVTDALLVVAVMCVGSAYTAWLLHKACDIPLPGAASEPAE